MNKHKLGLDLSLPTDAAACRACAARLVEAASAARGILHADIDDADGAHPKLCVHYDPTVLRLDEVKDIVERAGATLEARFEHLALPLAGLRHERQATLAEGLLLRQPGVLHVALAFGGRRLYLEFDPSLTTRSQLLRAAANAGVAPYEEPNEDEHGGFLGSHGELAFSLGCGVLAAVGWGIGKAGGSTAISTICFVAAYWLGSWFTVKEAALALRARRFEIDFLMLLAAAGAAVLNEWVEGALLLFLFTLGHALEGFAMSRARKAMTALAKLVPETALRLDSTGTSSEVAVGELEVGDRVLVKPNTRIPADAFVVSGTSTVDQAAITGESIAVEKRPVADIEKAIGDLAALETEHRVFAGTINGAGALTLSVVKRASDSTLARVVKMVAEAETQKSATQRFAERFERVFVPVILAVVCILLFAWVLIDEPFARSFYRAMAVLVAASPCALAIATPSAVLAGVARAAHGGVLVKGGAHLESLGLVQAIAFDKTGTLTEGKPKLTDVIPAPEVAERELLDVSVAVEKSSDHPLAGAIVVGGLERLATSTPQSKATGVEAIVGFGVRGRVGDEVVLLGKPGLFTGDNPLPPTLAKAAEQLARAGRTVMVVKFGPRFLGVLGVMDTAREGADTVVTELHRLGIARTIMLTGDNQHVGNEIARRIGIREVRGNLLPEQKVAAISELTRAKIQVAMVGDGVNDAPAMASATVGIAMGASGSDVALESADVALMADNLHALPFAVGLSRAAHRIIRQNLWVSLGMIAFLVPATILGFAKIGVAVSLHEGSTVLVVANALRLLAYRSRREPARALEGASCSVNLPKSSRDAFVGT